MSDATVYSIFAGYIPTLAYGKEDFKYARQTGQRRKVADGVRFDGAMRNLSGLLGVHRDGSLGVARVRGSIAWYEYSTKVKEIQSHIKDSEDLQRELDIAAQSWHQWFREREFSQEELLKDFQTDIGIQNMSPGRGERDTTGTGDYAMPEEQATAPAGQKGVRGRSQWKENDAALRRADRIYGKANAIDVYIRGRDQKIYRLDVTAMTMDTTRAHHGLDTFKEREKAGVTGKQIFAHMEKYGQARAEAKLRKYFNKMQTQNWNPPIKSIKAGIMRKSSDARDLLRALKQEELGLKDLAAQVEGGGTAPKELMQSMRGGGARDKGGWKKAADLIRNNTVRKGLRHIGKDFIPSGIKTGAMNSGLSFALHMLGNVLELFRSDSARQGGYSTGYSMGEQAASNWVIEVKHNIHERGRKVFEFMNLETGDVLIHNEATLTAVYRKQLWYDGESTSRATLETEGRNQNLLNTNWIFNKGTSDIDVGSVITMGSEHFIHRGSTPVHVPRSVGMVLPKRVNKDIDAFLQNAVAGKGDDFKNLRATLKKNIHRTDLLDSRRLKTKGRGSGIRGPDPLQTDVMDVEGPNKAPAIDRFLLGSGRLGREIKFSAGGENIQQTMSHAAVSPWKGNRSHKAFSNSAVTDSVADVLGQDTSHPWKDAGGDFGVNMRSSPFAVARMNQVERQFQRSIGFDPHAKNKQAYENIRKFLTSTNKKGMAKQRVRNWGDVSMGIAMSRGLAEDKPWDSEFEDRSELPAEQQYGFWATPYLSVLYPSTQVRVAQK